MAKTRERGDKRHKPKKAQRGAKTAPIEWEDIFQAIGHPSFILAADHTIMACNKAVTELTGKPAECFVGRKCYEVFHERNKPADNCPAAALLQSGCLETVEMEMEALDRTFLVSCTPVLNKAGALGGIIHIATDITERKEAAEKLQEQRDRAQKYLDIAAVILVVLDTTGRVNLINRKGCEILGCNETEIIGKNWFDDFVPESIRVGVKAVFRQLMAGEIESGEYFENPVLGRYGKERMIAWRNTILRDEKGNITGSLSSGEDITERKRAEQKLRDNQKRLKALAAELSIAEEHERRRIAMEIHDNLSQKLVMAKLNLQVLKASSSEQNIKDALDRECDIIAEIIEDTRCLTFELSNPVLYEIGLEQTVNNWMKTEIGDKAGLKYQFAPQGDKIEMDEDAKVFLFKAIRELLINVVKHAGANSVKVGIAAQNSEVVITVEDDGVGFDTSKLGLPSGTKGGFGLFNIRERLEYMGGRLEIDSAPGKGTRIIITAPVKKPESQRETAKLVPPISTL